MKKIRIINNVLITLFFSIAYLFLSCSINSENNYKIEDNKNQVSDEIILGNKIENPFSLKSERYLNSDIEPNYYYFRIRTTTLEGIDIIKSICGDLNIIPYDYEVIQGGTEFSENTGDDNHSPWYYYTLPTNYLDSFNSDEYEIEIIDGMYLSEDDLELINNPEVLEDAENKISADRFLWFKWKSAVPSGYVYVHDEVTGRDEPVPNVKVTVTQWCFTHSAYTNEKGEYNLGVKYTTLLQNNAQITVWFENENVDVMRVGYVSTSFYSDGHTSVGDLSGKNIYLSNGTNEQKYGNIIRASEYYKKTIKNNNINVTDPGKLKIWAAPNLDSAVTLMGSEAIGTQLAFWSSYIGLLGGPITSLTAGMAAGFVGSYIPDLIIGCDVARDRNTKKIIASSTENTFENVFHEMAHASHFRSLGIRSLDYWSTEFLEMLNGWGEVLSNNQKIEDNCYNDGKSERVCFVESWGFFFGEYLMYKFFANKTKRNYKLLLTDTNKAEYTYFYNQAYYELLTNGYSIKNIFEIYKKSNIASAKSFIDEFAKKYNLSYSDKEKLIKSFKAKGAKV
ncbi:MAG: hypothetical protein J5527_05515 [Treponema sp.]|nr:hypothetical protein [Treponema sp.]